MTATARISTIGGELKPDAPLRTAMLVCVPVAIVLNFDALAVNQKVQRIVCASQSSSSQVSPTKRSELSTNPLVCRSAIPKRSSIIE
jgi:hypothetical protein